MRRLRRGSVTGPTSAGARVSGLKALSNSGTLLTLLGFGLTSTTLDLLPMRVLPVRWPIPWSRRVIRITILTFAVANNDARCGSGRRGRLVSGLTAGFILDFI